MGSSSSNCFCDNCYQIPIIFKPRRFSFDKTKILVVDEDKAYIIKKINIKDLKKEDIQNRKKIMENKFKNINNIHIFKIIESKIENDFLSIKMEHPQNSKYIKLKDFIQKYKETNKKIKEEYIKDIIEQICLGLMEMHKNNIIHRDLTPDNIFINENNNKIKINNFFDFEILKAFNENNENNIQIYSYGDYKYYAPEISKRKEFYNGVDIYSLGCVIYELFTLNEYYDEIITERKNIELDKQYDKNWEYLIELLIKKRPCIDKILNEYIKQIYQFKFYRSKKENNEIKAYKIIKKLGGGGFGKVSLIEKDNTLYALKKINKENFDKEVIRKYCQNEINILSNISNDNIVKFYDSFEEKDALYIIMEYCENGNLKEFIKNYKDKNKLIEEEKIIDILIQICLGLMEIHKNKIIHRDLTPDNIFIGKNNKIKIGDFGISKKLNTNNNYTKSIGKIDYMAPEIINGPVYNYKVDIYSLGCIIYELFNLNKYYIDKQSNVEIKLNDDCNEEWENLIISLLLDDYEKRPDAEEVYKRIVNIKKNIETIQTNQTEENVNKNMTSSSFYPKKNINELKNFAIRSVPLKKYQ